MKRAKKAIASTLSVVGCASLGVLGCGSGGPVDATGLTESRLNPSSASAQTPPSDGLPTHSHPTPAFSFDVPNGSTIEFYELPGGVLVSEYGNANSPPVLRPLRRWIATGQFEAVLSTLRPDIAAPPIVGQLEIEVAGRSSSQVGPLATRVLTLDDVNSGGGGQVAQPDDCGNNCCNYSWVTANICDYSGDSYDWFFWEYGWSYVDKGDISYYSAAVCAVQGTSEFHVDINGSGGDWDVLEGYYRTYYWIAGCNVFNCPQEEGLTSTVNSQDDGHEHDYCGGIVW